MTAKPVIRTRLARQDVDDELTHYVVDEGPEQAVLFIAEIEQACKRSGSFQTSGLRAMRTSWTYPACVRGHLSTIRI
jgi:plasmid stabilization system protein ParE